jgi:hypothetical protein
MKRVCCLCLQEKSKSYLSFTFLFFALFTLSSAKELSLQTLQQAQELQLYKKPYWSKLVLIQNNQKRVNTQSFYFTKKQSNNLLKEELILTLEAFLKDEQHICKFPARYSWLKEQLQFEIKGFDLSKCQALNEFRQNYFDDLSLMYTTERYNSPASLFGHIFFKTKTKEIEYAINYAALVPEDENTFLYTYKGLNGIYQGEYFLIPFAQKAFEYNAKEFRDILEFELLLNEKQKERLYLHLFELLEMKQDYYFITRNCSSEILHLIEIADESFDLRSLVGYEAIPYKVIEQLQNLGVLKQKKHYLSRLKKFYYYVNALNSEQKALLDDILHYRIGIEKFDTLSLDTKAKANIVNAAITYIEIKSMQGDIEDRYIFPLVKLIAIQQELQVHETLTIPFENSIYSTNYSKVSLGHVVRKNASNYHTLGYRYLYRSRLDLQDSTIRQGSIELFKLQMAYKPNSSHVKLDSLTFFNIESYPNSDEYFSELTTTLRLGIEQVLLQEQKELLLYYDKGKQYEFEALSFVPKIMTGFSYRNSAKAFVGAGVMVEKFISPKTYIQSNNEYVQFSHGSVQKRHSIAVHQKVLSHSKIAIELSHIKDKLEQNAMRINYAQFF